MSDTPFILIPGRSSRQGVSLNVGKYTDDYIDETSTLRMHPEDMQALGVNQGGRVRMWNEVGNVEVTVIDAKDECPRGVVFICYGDKSSQLMGGETHGSGMPDSKGLDVSIAAAGKPMATSANGEALTETATREFSGDSAAAANVVVEDSPRASVEESDTLPAPSLADGPTEVSPATGESQSHRRQTTESIVVPESSRSSRTRVSEPGSASGWQVAIVIGAILALLLLMFGSL